MSTLEQRIRLREPVAAGNERDGARWWTQRFDGLRVEDHVIPTKNQPVREVAREALRVAGWLTG